METIAETSNLVKSKEVVGVEVVNAHHENLGKIYDIVLDKMSGKVVYAVLESGSFLGLGGKLFGLPWNSLKYDANKNAFRLHLDKEQLSNSPGFDKDNWPKVDNAYWSQTKAYYSSM